MSFLKEWTYFSGDRWVSSDNNTEQSMSWLRKTKEQWSKEELGKTLQRRWQLSLTLAGKTLRRTFRKKKSWAKTLSKNVWMTSPVPQGKNNSTMAKTRSSGDRQCSFKPQPGRFLSVQSWHLLPWLPHLISLCFSFLWNRDNSNKLGMESFRGLRQSMYVNHHIFSFSFHVKAFYFKYRSVYMPIPYSQSIPPLPPFLPGNYNFILQVNESVSVSSFVSCFFF